MAEPNYFKGACEYCHGHIEFPAAALGTRISCPHCGQQTKLRDPAQVPLLKAACGNCGGHLAFPAEAAGSVVDCPHCGVRTELNFAEGAVPTGRKTRRIWMIAGGSAAAVVAVLGLILAYVKLERGNGEDVELRRYELQPANGAEPARVGGNIVNHTKERFYSIIVEFELFDKSGKPVGGASDYLAILEPKDSWDFKAVVSRPDAATVKLVKIAKEK